MTYTYLKPNREPEAVCPSCGAMVVVSNLIRVRDGYGTSKIKCSSCHKTYGYEEAK